MSQLMYYKKIQPSQWETLECFDKNSAEKIQSRKGFSIHTSSWKKLQILGQKPFMNINDTLTNALCTKN